MNLLSSYLSDQIRNANSKLHCLHVKSDPEILHQFRVHLRRSVSLLRLYRPHARYRLKLKKALNETNKIRDLDVLMMAIDPMNHPKLYKAIHKYRNRRFKRTMDKSWREKTDRELHLVEKKLYKSSVCRESKQFLKHKANKRYHQTMNALNALSGDDHEKSFHKVRIGFKISRYALVFLQEMKIAKVSKKIKSTKLYQTELGDIQDITQQIKLLQKICNKKEIEGCECVIEAFENLLKVLKNR